MNYLTHHSEFQLVKNLKSGSIVAFNTLFHHYSNRLYQFSLKYLKSEEEAEELVQEVFTKIWEHRNNLKTELSFNSFLFTIAFNSIRKYFRKKLHADKYLSLQANEDFNIDTIQKIDYNSLKKFLDNLISMMPPRRKEVFIKSRFEGLSVKEIADEMKISKKTVENQLTEALRFIRTNLSKEHLCGLLFFILFIS